MRFKPPFARLEAELEAALTSARWKAHPGRILLALSGLDDQDAKAAPARLPAALLSRAGGYATRLDFYHLLIVQTQKHRQHPSEQLWGGASAFVEAPDCRILCFRSVLSGGANSGPTTVLTKKRMTPLARLTPSFVQTSPRSGL